MHLDQTALISARALTRPLSFGSTGCSRLWWRRCPAAIGSQPHLTGAPKAP